MTVQIDLETVRRLIMRSSSNALEGLGFNLNEDAPPLKFAFAYGAEGKNCVGIDISQEADRSEATTS